MPHPRVLEYNAKVSAYESVGNGDILKAFKQWRSMIKAMY